MGRVRAPNFARTAAVAALALGSVRAFGGLATNIAFFVLDQARTGQDQRYRERQVLNPENDEWTTSAPAAEGVPGDEIDQARALLAENKPGKAHALLKKWLKQNPGHERYYEGVFLFGESLFERKDFYHAYEQYELVVENTAGELFHTTLQRERDVALAFLSGQKRIVWGFLRLPAYDEGLDILRRIWERVPGTRLGEDALRTRANYYYNHGDMDLAQDEYANLAKEYPAGRFVQFAMLRSAEAAEAAFPGIRFDDRPLLEANERYRHLQESFPAYADREGVQERLDGILEKRAEKDLYIAGWYRRTQHPAAAEFYYREVLRLWPDTLAAAEARQHLRSMDVDLDAEEAKP